MIDADAIAREVFEPTEPTYVKVVDCFGEEIVKPDGSIDRQRLGEIVFNDPEKLQHLNTLVHNDIFDIIMSRKKARMDEKHRLIVLDIPLLYETGYEKYVDEVMVVYTDFNTQLKRLKRRDGLTEDEAIKRIASQESLEIKKEKADVCIDNNGTVEQTIKQLEDWLTSNRYSSRL